MRRIVSPHELHFIQGNALEWQSMNVCTVLCIHQLTRASCKLEVIAPLLVMKGMSL